MDARCAAAGGALLARVFRDPPFKHVAPDLAATPAITLIEHISAEKPLVDSYHALMEAMVARHLDVSVGKNRQRWCYLEGNELVRDDLKPLAIGWHSMRFSQLYSLCRDLAFTRKDLRYGK